MTPHHSSDLTTGIATVVAFIGVILDHIVNWTIFLMDIQIIEEMDAIVDLCTHLVGFLCTVVSLIYLLHRLRKIRKEK